MITKYIKSIFSLQYLKNNKTVKVILKFVSGNLVVSIISALSMLLYGIWIGPEVLGELRQFGILTSYFGLLLILVDAGFRRSYILEVGNDNIKKSKKIAEVAQFAYVGLTFIGLTVFLSLTILALLEGDIRSAVGWATQIAVLTVLVYGSYYNTLYKSNNEFLTLNRNNIQSAIFSFLLLPLVYYFEYFGLALRQFSTKSMQFFLNRLRSPLKISPKRNWTELKRLAKVSVPLQFPAMLESSVIKPSTNLFILFYFSKEGLGLFSYALLMQSFFMTLGVSINQIFITKFNLFYAKKTSYVASVKYMMKPIVFVFILGLIITIIISFSLPNLIDFIVPKYSKSGVIFGVLIFQLVFKLLASPLSILSISLKYKERLFLTLIKSFFLLLMIFFFPKKIIYIAYAMVFSEAIFILLGYLFIGIEYRKELINIKLGNNG